MRMTITTAMTMTDDAPTLEAQQLVRLMTWMSPTFPTGAFVWSSGLEAACRNERIRSAKTLEAWLGTSLSLGGLHNEAILCAAAYRCEEGANDLALAVAGSSTRYEETKALGIAFAGAAQSWRPKLAPDLPDPIALPVAVGILAKEQKFPLIETLVAFLHSCVINQVQAALRLLTMGQTDGLIVTKNLEAQILKTTYECLHKGLADIGSACFLMEVSSMQHETLQSRIFRS